MPRENRRWRVTTLRRMTEKCNSRAFENKHLLGTRRGGARSHYLERCDDASSRLGDGSSRVINLRFFRPKWRQGAQPGREN